MNNLTLTFLIALAFIAVLVLFGINFTAYSPFSTQSYRIINQNVRGMAVVHANKPYTLSYDQQNQVLSYLNQAVLAKHKTLNSQNLDFQSIVIYQFEDKPDITILPLGYDKENNLLFLLDQKRMKDTSEGKFKVLLSETYDH